jgi:hypothetical protein
VGVKFEVPGLFERNADEITERWSPGPGFATAGRCQNVAFMRVGEASSAALVMTVSGAGVRNAADIERVLTEFAQEPNGGLIVTPSPPECAALPGRAVDSRALHVQKTRPIRYVMRAGKRNANSQPCHRWSTHHHSAPASAACSDTRKAH